MHGHMPKVLPCQHERWCDGTAVNVIADKAGQAVCMLLIITNVHLVNGSHLPCGPVAPANKHKVSPPGGQLQLMATHRLTRGFQHKHIPK